MSSDAKHTLLCVDDEQYILNALKRLLRKEGYHLLTADSGEQGLEVLAENEVHLIISDQRMGGMSGTEFMALVKEKYPDVLRIILTGYTDVDSITESINKGHIYKFFLKPWNDQNLKLEIQQALQQYDLIQINRKLDAKIVEQNKQLKKMNENLEDLVKERTQEIALQNQALSLSHAVLEDLPLPIIGVDEQSVVMLANKMAFDIIPQQELKIGSPLVGQFPENIQTIIAQVIDKHQKQSIDFQLSSGMTVKAQLNPFSGNNRAKGAIIILSQ